MTRWRREVNCSDLWSTENNWLILCASSLIILRHRYILSCHDDACQMSNNQTSTWWILCLHFNTSGFNTGTSLGTLNHQHKDFVDPTTILPSPFLILSSGQHNSHHCQSGHNLQEWAPQVQNKDHERAGEQRRPDISVPDRWRSCQWDKRLHERKSQSVSPSLTFPYFSPCV